jgi:hypothetical protein
MGRATRIAAIALAGALALAPGAAGAADPEPKRLRGPLERAWRDATDMAARSLGAEQAGRLTLLAYAAAVGRTCEGLALDRDRYRAAFRQLAEEREAELTDPKKVRSKLRRVSYHLGVATGVFLAEHALDGPRFCAGARESIAADPEIAAFFTTSSAPTSAAP